MVGQDLPKLARHLEEPAYVVVGFGILGLQRVLVFRRALQRELGGGLRRRLEQLRPLVDEASRCIPPEAGEVAKAAGAVASDISREARELAKEAGALGRFGFEAVRAQVGRVGSRG